MQRSDKYGIVTPEPREGVEALDRSKLHLRLCQAIDMAQVHGCLEGTHGEDSNSCNKDDVGES